MMSLKLLFSAAILVFLIIIDIYSLKYPFEVKLFPLLVGIPATILMIMVTAKESFRMRRAMREEVLSKQSEQMNRSLRPYALIIAWMAGFLIINYVLGFLGGIPLFVFLYLKAHGLSWLRSLGMAMGLFIVIYCVFSLGMEMRLHPGLIYSLYRR